MLRFVLFLLGTVSFSRPGERAGALFRSGARAARADRDTVPELAPRPRRPVDPRQLAGQRRPGDPRLAVDSRRPAGQRRPAGPRMPEDQRQPGRRGGPGDGYPPEPPYDPDEPDWSDPRWLPDRTGVLDAPPPDRRLPGRRGPGRPGPGRPGPRRRWIPRWLKWSAVLLVIGLIFRRAIASVVLMALSGMLHLVGIHVHLPSIKFAWPWQTISAGTTSNIEVGPWVLQKIEGISRPALGQVNFNFVFTHKVSKNIGPWPCWYASTFYVSGHAAATVNLNPGASWWRPKTGHYQLRVLDRPAGGKPGHVAVTMTLPQPQLPQSAHDVTIDNIPSHPLSVDHSWTYPGFGCGVLVRPQFQQSVLYAQAQRIAFYRASHVAQVTGPMIKAAETQAVQTVRNNFVQPTLNALGYMLDRFTVRWASPADPASPAPPRHPA
jgi:hypothetical protein